MNSSQGSAEHDGPRFERIRHETRVRSLKVREVVQLTPIMRRSLFSGEDLQGFQSLGFDDHVKLRIPTASGSIVRRDYTPRRFDADARTLTIDFAIHEAGPATAWAVGAAPGDVIEIGGPRASSIAPNNIRRWLLIGDETALPAIGRRIEEATPGTKITSIVAVPSAEDQQTFVTPAELQTIWAHRPHAAANDAELLLELVRDTELAGQTFVWIAAEATVARAVREHVIDRCRYPRSWVKAAGYWINGCADTSEGIE